MQILLRAPLEGEWKICRMLLPETFTSVHGREYQLAFRDEAPRLVGAMAYRREGSRVRDLRLHVVPRFRRMGAGTVMLHALFTDGVEAVTGSLNVFGEPEAVEFCERNGFRRSKGLTTVETEVRLVREYLQLLIARNNLPKGLRLGNIGEAPLQEVARLHSSYVENETDLNPWRARFGEMPELKNSLVAFLDGQVAGILLWETCGDVGAVRSIVAEPGPASRWLNLLMLSEAADLMWAQGLRRVQFAYADDNRNTRRVAARFHARVIQEVAEYTWRAEAVPDRETGTLI